MSRTAQEKQQAFKQKLQSEGADSFADGPRPWEQWDESGNQNDNQVWEGTARRIYPKQKATRGFGDRLLSGLAVIALGSMIVGIAGVYFSTPSTPRQARSTIQPPPIVASRTVAPPAARPTEAANTATPVIAQLDTLAPPAAGIPAPPQKQQTILEPTTTTERTTPVIQADSIDKVAVETVITEGAVTTTVYTRQPSQDEPELVAMIATTAPPFTQEAAQYEEPPVAATTETTLPGQAEAPATEPVVVAQAEAEEVTAPAVVEQAAETVTEPTVVALAETEVTEPAVVEQTAEVITEPTIVAQTGAVESETAVIEETTKPVAEAVVLNTTPTTDAETAPDIGRELETATPTPVLPEAKTGKWVINLSSYTRKPTAERMLAVFQRKGVVDAEVFTTTINDKPMHRIRVTGFQSARSAKAEISTLEQQLDLEGAWVSKR